VRTYGQGTLAGQTQPEQTACGRWRFMTDAWESFTASRHGNLFTKFSFAGWRSSVARLAHNQEAVGSNPAPATSSGWRVNPLDGKSSRHEDMARPDTSHSTFQGIALYASTRNKIVAAVRCSTYLTSSTGTSGVGLVPAPWPAARLRGVGIPLSKTLRKPANCDW
jgi:hypothetical protein